MIEHIKFCFLGFLVGVSFSIGTAAIPALFPELLPKPPKLNFNIQAECSRSIPEDRAGSKLPPTR